MNVKCSLNSVIHPVLTLRTYKKGWLSISTRSENIVTNTKFCHCPTDCEPISFHISSITLLNILNKTDVFKATFDLYGESYYFKRGFQRIQHGYNSGSRF